MFLDSEQPTKRHHASRRGGSAKVAFRLDDENTCVWVCLAGANCCTDASSAASYDYHIVGLVLR